MTRTMTRLLLATAALTAQSLLLPDPAAAQAATGLRAPDDVVRSIYQALTASTPAEVRTLLESATTPDWKNCAQNDICETREATIARWSARIATVPALRFHFQDVLTVGERVVVRSEVRGTPVRPFMGIEPRGHGFRLMTIDIHEIRDGKVARTFHVEDWSRATRQLRGDPS